MPGEGKHKSNGKKQGVRGVRRARVRLGRWRPLRVWDLRENRWFSWHDAPGEVVAYQLVSRVAGKHPWPTWYTFVESPTAGGTTCYRLTDSQVTKVLEEYPAETDTDVIARHPEIAGWWQRGKRGNGGSRRKSDTQVGKLYLGVSGLGDIARKQADGYWTHVHLSVTMGGGILLSPPSRNERSHVERSPRPHVVPAWNVDDQTRASLAAKEGTTVILALLARKMRRGEEKGNNEEYQHAVREVLAWLLAYIEACPLRTACLFTPGRPGVERLVAAAAVVAGVEVRLFTKKGEKSVDLIDGVTLHQIRDMIPPTWEEYFNAHADVIGFWDVSGRVLPAERRLARYDTLR
jgi:hypothetical protein